MYAINFDKQVFLAENKQWVRFFPLEVDTEILWYLMKSTGESEANSNLIQIFRYHYFPVNIH